MIKVGDKIKFVSVRIFKANMKRSGRHVPYEDIRIQNEIANQIDKIVNIDDRKYFTENRHADMRFFIKERFEKLQSIELPDNLFEI